MDCDMSRSHLTFLSLEYDSWSNGDSWSDDEEGLDLTTPLIPTSSKPVSVSPHPIPSKPSYISPRSIEAQPRFGQFKRIDEASAEFANHVIEVRENNTVSSRPVSSLLPMVLFVYGAEAAKADYFFNIIQPPELGRKGFSVGGYKDSYLTGFELNEDTFELYRKPSKQLIAERREEVEGIPPKFVKGRVYILTEPAHLVRLDENMHEFGMGMLTRTEGIVTRVEVVVGARGEYRVMEVWKTGYTYSKVPAEPSVVENSESDITEVDRLACNDLDSVIDPVLLEISKSKDEILASNDSNGLVPIPFIPDDELDLWSKFGEVQPTAGNLKRRTNVPKVDVSDSDVYSFSLQRSIYRAKRKLK